MPRAQQPSPFACAAATLPLALLAACQATDSNGRPLPTRQSPASAARSSSNAPPTKVVPVLYQSLDTDSNGLVDTLTVSAYLFPPGGDSALPVWSDGQFEFSLVSADAPDPIATWTFPSDQVLRHRDTDLFGPTHLFSLDIRAAAGTDRLASQRANLSARFIRTDGVTVASSGGVGVRVGP